MRVAMCVCMRACARACRIPQTVCMSLCVGTRWTTWCVYISMISAFPLLIRFKQQYKRLAADKSRSMHSNDANEQINAS